MSIRFCLIIYGSLFVSILLQLFKFVARTRAHDTMAYSADLVIDIERNSCKMIAHSKKLLYKTMAIYCVSVGVFYFFT